MKNVTIGAVFELPELASRKQVAAYIGCSEGHVLKLKEIPFLKIGALSRYRREDVQTYLSKLAGGANT